MNIILIGMRGSGKTTVGNLLAKKLKRNFIETDQLIERKTGLTIRRIVETFGWKTFRNYESEIIKEVSTLKDVIIATGGGVVEQQNNVRELKKKGVIIWLEAEVKNLRGRIGEDKERPLLTKAKSMVEDLKRILIKRERLYKRAANYIINTDNRTPSQIVAEIIKHL